jgi:transcriptional regulator with XRE-family HTH domain
MPSSPSLSRAVSARVREILHDNKRSRGWTQHWLAQQLLGRTTARKTDTKMTQPMVSLILRGLRPKIGLDTWAEIAEAIELPLSTLIAQAERRIERITRSRSA